MRSLGWLTALLALTAQVRGEEEIPFPLRKSTTASKDGATYVVEGRQRLPAGVAVTCKQNIRIVGRGEDPTLEVAGQLIIEGQPLQEVVIENLKIEPAPQFQGIRIEWTKMSGSIATPDGVSVSGPLSLDSTKIVGPVNLAFGHGEIRLLQCEFQGQVVLAGLPGKGEEQADVRIRVLNCSGNDKQKKIELNRGFYAGLQISRAPDVLVRGNWLTGGAYEFEDCGELMFDGNTLVSARHVSVRQTKSGGFKRTMITKCDFYDVQLRLEAPTADAPDKVVIDKCWFSGIEDPDEILAHAVKDGTSDQSSGARAHFRKINKRPLCIGGEPVH